MDALIDVAYRTFASDQPPGWQALQTDINLTVAIVAGLPTATAIPPRSRLQFDVIAQLVSWRSARPKPQAPPDAASTGLPLLGSFSSLTHIGGLRWTTPCFRLCAPL